MPELSTPAAHLASSVTLGGVPSSPEAQFSHLENEMQLNQCPHKAARKRKWKTNREVTRTGSGYAKYFINTDDD